MFSLSGKKALVTGATGDIGSAIAKVLHKGGATVVLSGTRRARLEELASELGSRAHILEANLSDSESVGSLIKNTIDLAGGLDILVCNAGVTKDGLCIRMKDEDFEEVININLKSTFTLNRDAIRHMLREKWGRIINISSVVAYGGNPGQANYCASKAGMVGLTKSLAKEVASKGITINNIAPGFIRSAMTDKLNDAQKNSILESIPAKRMGEALDIAYAALYLASEEAGYVNGSTIHVNGGMLMV